MADYLYNDDEDLTPDDSSIYLESGSSEINDTSTQNTIPDITISPPTTPDNPTSPPDPVSPTVTTPTVVDDTVRIIDNWTKDISQNIGSGGSPIPTPDPFVVHPLVESRLVRVTRTLEFIIHEYESEYLESLHDEGYSFYAVYTDGTEDEIEYTEVYNLYETQIVDISDELTELMNSKNQHFWTDTSGIHVTDETRGSWEEYASLNFSDLSDSSPHNNILVNGLGIVLRSALSTLASFSRSGFAFYDGNGNNVDNITSLFGSSSIQIGKTNSNHIGLNQNGMFLFNGNADPLASFSPALTRIGLSDGLHLDIVSSGIKLKNNNIEFANFTHEEISMGTSAIMRLTSDNLSFNPYGISLGGFNRSNNSFEQRYDVHLGFPEPNADSLSAVRFTTEYFVSKDTSYAFFDENQESVLFIIPEIGEFLRNEPRSASLESRTFIYKKQDTYYYIYLDEILYRNNRIQLYNGNYDVQGFYYDGDESDSRSCRLYKVTRIAKRSSAGASHGESNFNIPIAAVIFFKDTVGDNNFNNLIDLFNNNADISIAYRIYYTKFISYRFGSSNYHEQFSNYSLMFGYSNVAIGKYNTTFGRSTTSYGSFSYANGYGGLAFGKGSHKEGYSECDFTDRFSDNIITPGYRYFIDNLRNFNALGRRAYFSNSSVAYGDHSHVEGCNTWSIGDYSHAEGESTIAKGKASHAEGLGTIAGSDYQTAIGKYNIDISGLFIVGNGTDDDHRSNAFRITDTGLAYFYNSIIIEKAVNMVIKSPTINITNGSNDISANTYYGLNMRDANDRNVGYICSKADTNGSIMTAMYAYNYVSNAVSNAMFGIGLDKSGNVFYSLSAPEKLRYSINAVNKAGDTMTGDLVINKNAPVFTFKSANVNAANSTNGISANQYPGFSINDSSNRIISRYEAVLKPDGSKGTNIYTRQYDANGNQTAQKGITMTIPWGSTTVNYAVSDYANFRTAIHAMSSDVQQSNAVTVPANNVFKWTYYPVFKIGNLGMIVVQAIKAPSPSSQIQLGSLPSGFRPPQDLTFTIIDNSLTIMRLQLCADGKVYCYNYNRTSGQMFNFASISCMYMITQ